MTAPYRSECPACVARRAEDARRRRWRVDPMGSTFAQFFSGILATVAALLASLLWVMDGSGEPIAVRALAVAGILCVVAVAAHVRREP